MSSEAEKALLADLHDISRGWRNNERKAERIERLYFAYEQWTRKAEIYLLARIDNDTKKEERKKREGERK